MKRLFCLSMILVALLGLGYVGWIKRAYPPEQFCRECPEPVPRIEDHVAAVMAAECPPCPECPTYETLKRAGVEVVCTNAFGVVPAVNYYDVENKMACNRIDRLVIRDKRIQVERK